MDRQESDRVWFVTGASTGFGRAISEAVLARDPRFLIEISVIAAR